MPLQCELGGNVKTEHTKREWLKVEQASDLRLQIVVDTDVKGKKSVDLQLATPNSSGLTPLTAEAYLNSVIELLVRARNELSRWTPKARGKPL